MKLEDALFNWLQMKIVSEARPEDKAAEETRLFFEEILREDHAVSELTTSDEDMRIHITYEVNGSSSKLYFDKDYAEQLLHDINSNPKYNQ
ncbi:hypothetical protein [Paenibacillus sp. UNC451MF]|uniref:hypothetical protein n=1 Tax=Paenibacillus sp. UNC451MF TaxID=1449063 RepID=UPI0004917CC9|nr:hypothetical protein [Paenibacillus sp. UNC451MF]